MTATSRRDFLKSLSALSASLRQQIEAEVTGLDGAIAAIRVRREQDAIAAPRSEAKSTLVSQLFVLWRLLTGRKKYPVIVMDSIDQAYPMLEAIKAELEFNARLLMDFPEGCG